jgi:hypothetical protein
MTVPYLPTEHMTLCTFVCICIDVLGSNSRRLPDLEHRKQMKMGSHAREWRV